MPVFTAFRALVYMTGFLVVWAWLALTVRQLDPFLGVKLPEWARGVGVVFLVLGAVPVAAVGAFFIVLGSGTPAPFDPPRRFLAVGPFKYVRNPMYIGGTLLLLGFGLWHRSVSILLLLLPSLFSLHFFVVFVEEPGLERRFGDSYREYKRSVNRWLPRLR